MEYTAIGDAVNVAARVEALTKVVGAPLLLTEATRQALRACPCLEPLPAQEVRGHAPVDVLKLREGGDE
jgi:adenylate cyclase